MSATIFFVETECVVGGARCEAWDRWFWESVELDPNSTEEDRDPVPRLDHPFVVSQCGSPLHCPLRARAVRKATAGAKLRAVAS